MIFIDNDHDLMMIGDKLEIQRRIDRVEFNKEGDMRCTKASIH